MAHTKTTRSIFSLIAALLAVFLMAAPALAHHKDGHEQGTEAASEDSSTTASEDKGKPEDKGQSAKDNDGDADSDPGTTVTEDTDNNDGGTKEDVADENDNAHPSGKDRSVESGNSTSNPNQGKAESDPDDDGRGPDRTNGGPDKPGGTGGVDLADQDGNNGCGNDDDFEDDNEGHCGGKPAPVKDTKPCDADKNMPGTQPCTSNPPCDKDATMPGTQPCDKDEVKDTKITICHATGSSTNPYVVITISENGLSGHGDHAGDIIPMPAGGCPGVLGEVITNNPCPFDATMAANDPNCGPVVPDLDEDDSDPDVVLGETVSRDEDEAVPAVAAERNPKTVEVLGAVLPFTGASLIAFVAAAFGLMAAGLAALKLRSN